MTSWQKKKRILQTWRQRAMNRNRKKVPVRYTEWLKLPVKIVKEWSNIRTLRNMMKE